MPDIKEQARELGSVITAKSAEASAKYAEFDALRESAKSEGVDFTTNTEAFDKLDAAGKAYDAVRDELAALQSKRNRLVELIGEGAPDSKGDPERAEALGREFIAKNFGREFVQSESYKTAAERSKSSNTPIGNTDAVKVMDRASVKTLISIAANADLAPENDRLGMVVPINLASLDFLNVIANGTTDSDTVEWLEETTYTNSASPTAETTAAPESALAWTLRTKLVQEIPHFIPITRRSMQDQAFVESWINSRLVDGVRRRLLQQVLTGAGTGTDLEGIYTNSSIGSVDRSSASVTMLDGLHKCLTTIRLAAFKEPDFIGIHPTDYETIVLSRAGGSTTTDGAYLYGNPVSGGPKTIWGVNALVDSNFTSGSPLVGVGGDAMLWVRSGIELSASDSHANYFTERKVALLATMRAAFGVIVPGSFAKCVA